MVIPDILLPLLGNPRGGKSEVEETGNTRWSVSAPNICEMAVEEKGSKICLLKTIKGKQGTHTKSFLSINAHTNWTISEKKLPAWWSELTPEHVAEYFQNSVGLECLTRFPDSLSLLLCSPHWHRGAHADKTVKASEPTPRAILFQSAALRLQTGSRRESCWRPTPATPLGRRRGLAGRSSGVRLEPGTVLTVRCKAPCPSAGGLLLCVWLPSAASWRRGPAGAPGNAVAQQHPPLGKQHTFCIKAPLGLLLFDLYPTTTHNKTASHSSRKNFTFTGHVHAEVDAIDWIHVDGARLHEHGRIPLCALASCRVGGFVLPPKVGFSLHYPPPQLGTIRTPAGQHLKCKGADFPITSN